MNKYEMDKVPVEQNCSGCERDAEQRRARGCFRKIGLPLETKPCLEYEPTETKESENEK